MRVESSTQCKSGGWMHWPNGRERDWRDQIPTPPRREKAERPAGDKAQVDAAYRALLRRCPLSMAHRAHLEARGLSAEQIERHGYATLPESHEERCRIAATVAAELDWDPVGVVPGFIRKNGRIELVKMSGILIPFYNVRGQIRGLQVRLTNPGSGPKYVWFSAGDRDGGIGQNGNICHVARPPRQTSTKRVVVTEGPIKANIAADHFGCIVLAVAGVANIAGVPLTLKALGGAEDVAIAYDQDAEVNQQVAMHEAKLALELDGAGYRVAQWTWLLDDGKGIDDLIGSGILPFPIPHPALTQDRGRSDDPEQDPDKRFRDLWRLHSLSIAAHHSPNLGTERHTLTDLAMTLSNVDEGELVPMCYAKLGDQAGISASAAERHLGKVGIRPKDRDAGLLTGLVEVEVRPGPARIDPETGAALPGRDTTYMRRLAPVRDILERIAAAPEPATGKRNNHGGKPNRGCPQCGSHRIKRTTTDHCADCGELLKQPTVRIITSDEAEREEGQHHAAPPPDDPYEEPSSSQQGDARAHGQHDAAPSDEASENKNDPPSVTVYRGSNLPPDPDPLTEREARRAAARADLERRYGPTPPAWQDLAPAQTVLTEADHAQDDEMFRRAKEDLADFLSGVARETGRAPVPKPGGRGRTLIAGGAPPESPLDRHWAGD